jgi:uncharacterized protein YukE
MRWPFRRKKEKEVEKSVQTTSTDNTRELTREESEYLFEPEKLKEEVKQAMNNLNEIEKYLQKIDEYSNKLEQEKKKLQRRIDKYKSSIQELTNIVDQLHQRYQDLYSKKKPTIEKYRSDLKEVIKKVEELESAKKELGKLKSRIDEIMSGTEEVLSKVMAYSAVDGETVAKILTRYKDTKRWEEFKELLVYTPEVLEASLAIGKDIGYEAPQLLPIAAAYSLKKWDKNNGKPPAEIVKYNIDTATVEKYLIELSNQSRQASIEISSYMEK